jgi:hypothetical protein
MAKDSGRRVEMHRQPLPDVRLFERRRIFCALEACILASLWTALPTMAEEPSDEGVHELIEEGVQ